MQPPIEKAIANLLPDDMAAALHKRTLKGIRAYGQPLSAAVQIDEWEYALEEILDLLQYCQYAIATSSFGNWPSWRTRVAAIAIEMWLAMPEESRARLSDCSEFLDREDAA